MWSNCCIRSTKTAFSLICLNLSALKVNQKAPACMQSLKQRIRQCSLSSLFWVAFFHLSVKRSKSCFPFATSIPDELYNFAINQNFKLQVTVTGRPNTLQHNQPEVQHCMNTWKWKFLPSGRHYLLIAWNMLFVYSKSEIQPMNITSQKIIWSLVFEPNPILLQRDEISVKSMELCQCLV